MKYDLFLLEIKSYLEAFTNCIYKITNIGDADQRSLIYI